MTKSLRQQCRGLFNYIGILPHPQRVTSASPAVYRLVGSQAVNDCPPFTASFGLRR